MTTEDEKQQIEAVKTELRNESRALMDSVVKDQSNRKIIISPQHSS